MRSLRGRDGGEVGQAQPVGVRLKALAKHLAEAAGGTGQQQTAQLAVEGGLSNDHGFNKDVGYMLSYNWWRIMIVAWH
jgi:hypothetical protein